MFGLSSSSKEGRFAVLFDIGSASIGVSIVDFQGKPSKLVWSSRYEYGYLSGHDYDRYSKTMYATLLEAGMKASSEGFKVLKSKVPSFSSKGIHVYCVLSPPWFYGAVHTQVVSKEKPFQVSAAILDTIADDTLAEVLHSPESALWQEVMGAPLVLETFNDEVHIDGYPVTQYEKRSAKELSITSYIAIVPKKVQKHLDEVIEKVFPNFDYSFSSSARILSALKSHMYVSHTTHRSILVEVEEEITSVAILERDSLQGVASIPVGTNHILRALSPKAQTATEAQTALDVILKKTKLSEEEEYPETIQTTLKTWHEDLIEKVRLLSGGVTPPTEALLVSGNAWTDLFKETLKTPWEMPGIGKKVEVTVYPVNVTSGKTNKKKPVNREDNRLSIFAHLLSHYTK